jgi:hypothetical protein
MTVPKKGDTKEFPWGEIVSVQKITDEIDVVIYHSYIYEEGQRTREMEKGFTYHPYVGGHDTNCSFHSMEEAIIYAICHRHLEINEAMHAERFISRMLKIR